MPELFCNFVIKVVDNITNMGDTESVVKNTGGEDMRKVIQNGEECLVMTRRELEEMLLLYAANEMRAENLMLKEKNDVVFKSLEYQMAKARGFKESFEGLMYFFTGHMVNIEKGKLIERNGK